jgi:hypothetical protein
LNRFSYCSDYSITGRLIAVRRRVEGIGRKLAVELQTGEEEGWRRRGGI